jgi:signal transduction histidine kinase
MEKNFVNLDPIDEEKRLENLMSYKILDTGIEDELEHLTHLAAAMSESPIALITLVDKDRQWFKSRFGLDLTETHRSMAFCHYTIMEDQVMEVPDATIDERFAQNPLVLGDPNMRHYAGAPLKTREGYRLGSLCVIDRKSKILTEAQKVSLSLLSEQVVRFFELKKKEHLLESEKQNLEQIIISKDSELSSVNLELNTFIYKASHTLRGPLATIQGISDYGLERYSDNQDLFLLFNMITKTSKGLDITLSKLLEAVEIKNKPLEINLVDLGDIKKELFSFKKFSRSSISFFANNIPENRIWTDKYLLLSILKNLVENSVNYKSLSRKLVVDIVFEKIGDKIKITIKDNAVGIPIDVQNNLFNLFFRGSHISKGTGLGLFLVYKAVMRLNGEITFKSEIDRGTIFYITFPIHPDQFQ